MVRHLLTVYPLSRRHFPLQRLSQYRIERHFAIRQCLINEVARDKKLDELLHTVQRITHTDCLVYKLKLYHVVL